MNNSKKVLVTGIGGLIGKELETPLKNAGFEIYAISTSKKGQNIFNGNLFDTNFVKNVLCEIKPQYLLNFAWKTVDDYLTTPDNYFYLTSSINLLYHFKKNKGKRFVSAGTCFEYNFKNEPLKETDKLFPQRNAYTYCKNTMREISEKYSKNNNISYAHGRIFYVYGKEENKNRLGGRLINNLKNNEPVIIKDGYLIRDYMCNKDIASAFVRLLDSDIEGPVNICTGKGITISEFANKYANKFQKTEFLKFEKTNTNQPPIIVGDNSKLKYVPKYSIDKFLDELI